MKRHLAATALVLATAAPASGHHANDGCQTLACDHRVGHKRGHRIKLAAVRPHLAWLNRVAWCESNRRWHIATGNGFYGGLQFTLSSWRAVGGRGWPHQANPLEQMYRAVLLLRVQGTGAWPVCGR